MEAYARVSTLLFIVLLGLAMLHVEPVAASDGELPPGWVPGYTYRKKHLIVGAPNAGVGYQMMFIVRRASGTDTNNTVYVSAKCKEDFSDVRFADADGNVFPYAITFKSADEAWFWIKPTVDLSTNQYIYVYYGNPDAMDESNIDNTFVYAESWDNSTLNSRWTVDNQGNGYQIDTGQRRLKLLQNCRIKSSRTIYFPSSYVVEGFYAAQYDSQDNRKFKIGTWGEGSDEKKTLFCIHNAPWNDDPGVASVGFKAEVWLSGQQIHHYAAIGHTTVVDGGSGWGSYIETTAMITRNSTNHITVWIGGYTATRSNTESPDRIFLVCQLINYAYIYNFKIRKYVNPEPSHGTWFDEESITVTHARLNVNVEPSFLSYVAFTLDYPTNVLFAPWSGILTTGSHTLTVLDTKIQVNATHVYGFKCWKKGDEIVSFDKSYTVQLQAGTTNVALVFVAHNVSIVSDPEMYVRLEVDGWQVQTPTNIFRGTGYYNFRVLDTQLYYNATHILRFYGWYVDNVYIGGSDEVNIYISYNTRIKLAYRYVEIPAPPPMTFKAQIVELGTILAGTSRDFAITVIFDANSLSIQSVEFTAKAEWLQVLDPLPAYATKGVEAVGTFTINCRLTLPQNVQGYYTIPFKITAKTSGDVTITTASYITFTATTTPTAVEAVSAQPTSIVAGYTETIIRIIGNPIILILLIALTIWLATYTIKKR
ncbi:MAG: DUF2341 domain-containing protein [Candidatus Bathyarchaeia archaeon]